MSYAKACPQFKWMYGYEVDRDPWVTISCHWCLHLDEGCLSSVDSEAGTGYKCEIPERNSKKNAWDEAHKEGQSSLTSYGKSGEGKQ